MKDSTRYFIANLTEILLETLRDVPPEQRMERIAKSEKIIRERLWYDKEIEHALLKVISNLKEMCVLH